MSRRSPGMGSVGRGAALALGVSLVLPSGSLPHGHAQDASVGAPSRQPASSEQRTVEPTEDGLVIDSTLDDDPIGVPNEGTFTPRERAPKTPAPSDPDASSKAEDSRRYGPPLPLPHVREGRVLSAHATTREIGHAVRIELAQGLALVETEMQLTTRWDQPHEIRYRLPVPRDAVPTSLRVCNDAGCREGVPDRSTGHLSVYDDAVRARPERAANAEPPRPIAHVATIDEEDARALRVRAAPLVAGDDLRVAVSYVARATAHGGIVRLRLPPRGTDGRTAPAEVEVDAGRLLATTVNGAATGPAPVSLESRAPIEVSARMPSSKTPHVDAWHWRCASHPRCARIHLSTGSRPMPAAELVLAIDASPSTEGPARGRIPAALASLLAAMPPQTRLRVLAFASDAEPILPRATPVERAPLRPMAAAVMQDLGSATRFDAAWKLARGWLEQPGVAGSTRRLLIVGDGGLTRQSGDPFRDAEKAGIEVSVLNVADRATTPALRRAAERTGGVVVDAGAEARQAARGRSAVALEERLERLFAPVAGPSLPDASSDLRAGEQQVWQGPLAQARRLLPRLPASQLQPAEPRWAAALRARDASERSKRTALAAVDPRDFGRTQPPRPPVPSEGETCDPRGPAFRHSGVSRDASPVALVAKRSCRPDSEEAQKAPDTPDLGKGMPAQPLLSMLRDRIIPVARGCFRRDRAGRADYSVRAVFHFELAEREVISAEVEGEISNELRECLLSAVGRLDVPRFTGTVKVQYPLMTEADPPPPALELAPDVAERVDSLL